MEHQRQSDRQPPAERTLNELFAAVSPELHQAIEATRVTFDCEINIHPDKRFSFRLRVEAGSRVVVALLTGVSIASFGAGILL